MIDIKRLSAADTAVFARIAPDVFDAAVDSQRLSAYLAAPGHRMIVALHEGEVVGQVAAVVHRHPDKPSELYIDELGVAEAFRRRGLARAMLDAMLAWGRELGCEEWWVGTETDNVPARGLYDSYGGEGEIFALYARDL